jgi:CRISPR-associated protein Cas1
MEQLVLTDKKTKQERTLPIEDVGFVVLEHPEITLSQQLISHLTANNVAVVFCDARFMPTSMLLNLDGNYLQSKRFREQVTAKPTLTKRLWQQTVKAKIENQGLVLEEHGKDAEAVFYKSKKVLSGDTTNEEAKAAIIYWQRLLGKGFRRERFGFAPNALLNYGYAILRAATARAITGSGLHPSFGIFHHNQYNSYCLADDLMEPYRPFIDLLVMDYLQENDITNELTKACKAHLLQVLAMDVEIQDKKSPLQLALSTTTASLVKALAGEEKWLRYPRIVKYGKKSKAAC